MSSTDLVPISVAAQILGVSAITLRRWEAQGKLLPDTRTLGGSRRYSQARLKELLRKNLFETKKEV